MKASARTVTQLPPPALSDSTWDLRGQVDCCWSAQFVSVVVWRRYVPLIGFADVDAQLEQFPVDARHTQSRSWRIITNPEPIFRWKGTRRKPAPCKRLTRAGSLRSRRWAGCITATSGVPPEK